MSVPEKLQLMDALWEDLSTTPGQFEPPAWHRKELEKTKARRDQGLEEPMTLEDYEDLKELREAKAAEGDAPATRLSDIRAELLAD